MSIENNNPRPAHRRAAVPTWVWALLAAAHLAVFGAMLTGGTWNFADTDRYQQAAANLRDYGVLYARPWGAGLAPAGPQLQEFTIRPPGYPALLVALGGPAAPPVLLLVLQNLLSLASIGAVLTWWARYARPTRRQWTGAAGLALTFPSQLIYANAVMSEVALQAVVLALVALGLRFGHTRRSWYFAGASAALAVALLIKPVFYPLAGVAVVVGLVLGWRGRRPALALLGLLPALVAGAYMQRNLVQTGYFHFSSIAEINLLHYNAAGVARQLRGAAGEEAWVAAVLHAADAQPTFAQRQGLIRARATALLWAHPAVYARQQLQGMAAFFLDPGRFDLSTALRLPPPPGGGLLAQSRSGGLVRAILRLPLGLLAVLGLIGLANAGRLALAVRGFGRLGAAGPTLRAGRWLAAGLVLYVALLTGPLGAARFLVPVWPLLLALALAGLAGRRKVS